MGPRICLDSGEDKHFLPVPVIKYEIFHPARRVVTLPTMIT